MTSKKHPDSYWRKKLSKEKYEALRLGAIEEKGTGKYVNTDLKGEYVCAGCGAKLFDSDDKYNDNSGYATFCLSPANERVSLESVYPTGKKEVERIVCSECGGILGVIFDDFDIAPDRKCENLVHLNSSSIFLRKKLTPRNYPLLYILAVSFLIVCGLYAWALMEGRVFNETKYEENNNNILNVQVDGKNIPASVVQINNLNPQNQSVVFGKEAIFVVFSKDKNSPRLKLPKRKLDVLWLDSDYYVVSIEKKNGDEENNILIPFDNAVFALVTSPEELSGLSIGKGDKINITDKNGLL